MNFQDENQVDELIKKFESSKIHYWDIKRNQACVFLVINAIINVVISLT